MTLSAAMSIDGKIASRTGDSALSSRRDLARVHRLRAAHDAILVGINTVRADDPLLTVRYARGKNPVRVVIDARASLEASSRIARTCGDVRTIVAAGSKAPRRNVARLRGAGIEVIVCGGERIGIRALLGRLGSLKIRSVLVEGGSSVNWEFARLALIDEMIVCIVPRILGGAASPSLVGGAGFARVASSPGMRLRGASRRGGELLVRYSKL